MPTQDRRGRGDGAPRRRPAAAKTSDKLAADAFEQPVPEDMTADLESQAADFMADNDAWMYGPNAPTVLEILDRLEEMGPEEARPLAQAWPRERPQDRPQARRRR